MQLTPPLGIFGGTFDPLHNGHLFPIIEGAQKADVQRIALLPCHIPSHKSEANVSSQHRLKMVELVCQDYPLFYPDSKDIERRKPTYSIDSLQEFRQANPRTPLCFFIGTDSLNGLPNWYKWQDLFSLCHFIVCQRICDVKPSLPANSNTQQQLATLLQQRQTFDPRDLHNQLAGHIFLADTQPLSMSSTQIRKQLAMGKSVDSLLPAKVMAYIQQHKLYQANVEI